MKIHFLPDNLIVDAAPGSTIMDALINAGLGIDAPCGGRGVCGKCKVNILGDSGPSEVLACKTEILSDLTVDISAKTSSHRILMSGVSRHVPLSPALHSFSVSVPKPSTTDLRSCWDRLRDSAANAASIDPALIPVNPSLAADLYQFLEAHNYSVDVIFFNNDIIDVAPPGRDILAIAYDIGTTTVAAFLLDLKSGSLLAQASTINPQVQFGADVIMRGKYALDNGCTPLSDSIRSALSDLALQCLSSISAKPHSLYLASIVGNTSMHHLFFGISPASLAFAPYTAALTQPIITNANSLSLNFNPHARLIALPNIAGFVGADTVAAVLAAQLDSADNLTLLIDIGTNGEMVLGNKHRLIACSTAAGPAFEGALISCGMRGAPGAIDHVSLSDDHLSLSIIDSDKPLGICGSGLIDLISELLRVGIIDPSGRLLSHSELSNPLALPFAHRISSDSNSRSFIIADSLSSANASSISLSQKDIREVQLAKAAMAAGISIMAHNLNVDICDISSVLIAGAFGTYMSPLSACGIALIPPVLLDRVVPIGNAAGQGAIISLLNSAEYDRAASIANSIEYLELAAHPIFQDTFVDNLEFPSPASS